MTKYFDEFFEGIFQEKEFRMKYVFRQYEKHATYRLRNVNKTKVINCKKLKIWKILKNPNVNFVR